MIVLLLFLQKQNLANAIYHTLSLDSCCRPTTCKSSSPAGLSTLVYPYVVDCDPAFPYAYSSSTHRFPHDHTPIEATSLSATFEELGLGLGLGLGWLSGLGLDFLLVSASFTHSNTLSLDSCCRPTAGKSSSPAGLSTLVYVCVVDCVSSSPYTYSSSTHGFPDESTPIEATPLSVTSAKLGLVWVWVWDWIHWHTSPRTRSPSSRHPPFTH